MSFGISPQFKISCRIYEKKVKIYIYLQEEYHHVTYIIIITALLFRQHYSVSDDENTKDHQMQCTWKKKLAVECNKI
jgi:hypothetical protein